MSPQLPPLSYPYASNIYRFCSTQCLGTFKIEPARYLREIPAQRIPERTAPGTVYPCPMHPEVRQDGPGAAAKAGWRWSRRDTDPGYPKRVHLSDTPGEYPGSPGHCPTCGMTLEPRTISLAEEENIELKEMARRFWLSTLLALPLSLPL